MFFFRFILLNTIYICIFCGVSHFPLIVHYRKPEYIDSFTSFYQSIFNYWIQNLVLHFLLFKTTPNALIFCVVVANIRSYSVIAVSEPYKNHRKKIHIPSWLMIDFPHLCYGYSRISWYRCWCIFFLLHHHLNDVRQIQQYIIGIDPYSTLIHNIFDFPFPTSTSTYGNKNFFLYPTWTKICFSRIFIINPIISSKFLYPTTITSIEKTKYYPSHPHREEEEKNFFVCKHFGRNQKTSADRFLLRNITLHFGYNKLLVHYIMYVFEYIKT